MPKIYLSPSFQQQNIGVGDYGTEEKRCNEIADVVERELKKNNNFIVVRNNPNMSLTEVIKDSNNSNSDVHFSIHTNAGDASARGCEVYAFKQGDEGDKLAQIVYKRLSNITPANDRGVKYDSLAETRQTKAISVLVEVGFHSNAEDAKWIIENTELIGKELAESLYEYFNIQKDNSISNNAPVESNSQFEKYNEKIGQYQKLLNEIYGTNLNVDNWWGAKTENATKQKVALKNGSKGALVRWYQERLKELGYDLGITGNNGIDGDFRDKTETATKQFQEKYNLIADGIAGVQVIKKLVELM